MLLLIAIVLAVVPDRYLELRLEDLAFIFCARLLDVGGSLAFLFLFLLKGSVGASANPAESDQLK